MPFFILYALFFMLRKILNFLTALLKNAHSFSKKPVVSNDTSFYDIVEYRPSELFLILMQGGGSAGSFR